MTDAEVAARRGDDSTPGTDSAGEIDDRDTGAADSGADTGGPLLLWCLGADGDGAGNPDVSTEDDEAPLGYVDNAWDCDDADMTEPVFVSTDAIPSGVGSLLDPVGSLQEAANLAEHCIRVQAGTYSGDVDLGGRNLDIEGVAGAEQTTLQGSGADAVVRVDGGETARLAELTIGGGGGSPSGVDTYGGGVLVIGPASARLEGVNLVASHATAGGGVYASDTDISLVDVLFVGNDAYVGGGLAQSGGELTGARVVLAGNTGGYGTAALFSYGSTTINNLVAHGNRGTVVSDGICVLEHMLSLENATIIDHDIGLTIDTISVTPSTIALRNVILGGGDYGALECGEKTLLVSDSMLFDWNYGAWYPAERDPAAKGNADANQKANPGFVAYTADGNPAADDLHLGEGSPATDAGDPVLIDADGSRSDIGAYGGELGDW